MCKRLSERAADDLLAFMRKVMREARNTDKSGAFLALHELDNGARHVLAKHGLLTPADDPKVAAVFMEEDAEEPETYTETEGNYRVTRSRATGRVIHEIRIVPGSPSRFQYANKETSE
jgi:hypothetical protein